MTICVCIASRGRPQELDVVIHETMERAADDDTDIAVALDNDDPSNYVYGNRSDRERSLGTKYNRAASYADPGTTLYVLGVDDCYIATEGWDDKLLAAASKFQDGVGVVYFGPKSNDLCQLPEGMAVTKGWIEQVGFFCPTLFPFWWHDTWIDELARMTGRYVWANVEWNKFGHTEKAGAHKTTRMREVSWWARFFDSTRQMRVDKAMEMINRLDYPEWLRSQLKQEMQATANMLWRRNGILRDRGAEFEKGYGAETAPPDAGYQQIKTEAYAMLAQMSRKAA